MSCSAYIDGANLHKGIQSLGWNLDYNKFYIWLTKKYKVNHVYIFLGHIPKHQPLYNSLTEIGYNLIFKEVTTHLGTPKGNCDAEMVLQVLLDFYEHNVSQVVLITGDGDFACLVDFLVEKLSFLRLLVPNRQYCSYLLRKRNVPTVYLESPRLISYIKKDP